MQTLKDKIIGGRARNYQFESDLGTEMALRWSMDKHGHSLTRIFRDCRWCITERRVFRAGHLASLKKPPTWWKRFIREWQDSMTKTRD